MWNELKNTTDLWRDGNNSSKFVSEQPWLSVTELLSNGSAASPPTPGTDAPSERESGIVPGVIAAAVFIGFLLALYAVLWKCMVTAPQRQEKRRRARELRGQLC